MPGRGKEYGLILPNKRKENNGPTRRLLNPLATSDDELEKEEGESLNWIEASLKKSAGNSGQHSLQKRLLREAIEEDSTIFQYDEVYDDIKATQQEEKERKTQQLQKKPKYIETILKHSEKRKLENERRMERKVQKEREAEGNEFADKESFVTPSYLKKLEELKKAEEAEQREKYIEEKIDVHKHKNFGVFYNHLFEQRVGGKEIKQEPEDSEEPGTSHNKSQIKPKNYRTQNDLSDEEPIPDDHLNIDIKKEVVTSSSSDDETPGEGKKDSVEKVLDNGEHSTELFKRKYKSGERNIRHRSSSRDRAENKYRKRESDDPDKRFRDKNEKSSRNEIEKSRDRNKRHRSRSTTRSSKERTREKSRDRDRRGRSRDRNKQRSSDRREKSRDRRERSNSKDKREKSRSRSRGRRERSKPREKQNDDRREREKRSKRSKSKEKQRRRGKSEDSKEKSSENRTNETHSKTNEKYDENRKTENGNTLASNKPSAKQSINTTLGATDINKMKIEDRIKRFKEIFPKKTVDKVFESAVQRYFQRKAERGSGGSG